MPLTIIVATVYGRDMMTMSEMKTNDTMQKTTSTMNDASECVSARTCGSHAPSRMRTHDAMRFAPEQSKTPYNAHIATALAIPRTALTVSPFRPQLAADDASSLGHRQDQGVGR